MQRLQRALDEIPALGELTHESREFQKWQRNTRVAIDNIFGLSSSQTQEFVNTQRSSLPIHSDMNIEAWEQASYNRGLDEATAILESMFSEVDEYWEEDGQGDGNSCGIGHTPSRRTRTRYSSFMAEITEPEKRSRDSLRISASNL